MSFSLFKVAPKILHITGNQTVIKGDSSSLDCSTDSYPSPRIRKVFQTTVLCPSLGQSPAKRTNDCTDWNYALETKTLMPEPDFMVVLTRFYRIPFWNRTNSNTPEHEHLAWVA